MSQPTPLSLFLLSLYLTRGAMGMTFYNDAGHQGAYKDMPDENLGNYKCYQWWAWCLASDGWGINDRVSSMYWGDKSSSTTRCLCYDKECKQCKCWRGDADAPNNLQADSASGNRLNDHVWSFMKLPTWSNDKTWEGTPNNTYNNWFSICYP